jgi:hypothetical protein
MKACPTCHLANPDGALRCDCGYDFGSGVMKASYLPLKERLPAGKATAKTAWSYVTDAVVLVTACYWVYDSSWIPKAFSRTLLLGLYLALYAAGQIWRYRRHFATTWHKWTGT